MRILLAEDDKELSNAVTRVLKVSNFDVDQAYDGQEALDYIDYMKYDVIIMDIMMPKMDGITCVKRIRDKKCHTPIIMLTAMSETDDKVNGLDAGADDYLTKPFVVKELLARIRALLRRDSAIVDNYSIGNVTLDSQTFEIKNGNKSQRLTAKEYKLMELLIRNKNQIISTEKIMDDIWDLESDAEINVVWVFISSLRKKLEQIEADHIIKAVRGLGYRLEAIS
jgi:DNA-binding response OmpR family regulator